MEYPDAKVQVERTAPPSVVVSGEINHRTASTLREALTELINEGCDQIWLDFKTVDFVDSSGIGVIVGAAHKLQSAGGELQLRNPTRQLEHALQVSGFASLLSDRAAVLPAPSPPIADSGRIRQTLNLSVPPGADVGCMIRRRVMELASSMPFDADSLDDIKLSVGEAASNAFRHGRFSDPDAVVDVKCTGDIEGLTVEISNPGGKFDTSAVGCPNLQCLPEGGMGIYFMRVSMDSVDIAFDQRTVTVRMTKKFRRAADNNGQ